jgi:hypothetical protein
VHWGRKRELMYGFLLAAWLSKLVSRAWRGLAGPRICQNVFLTRISDARFARDCRPSAVDVCGFFFEGNRNRNGGVVIVSILMGWMRELRVGAGAKGWWGYLILMG